MAGPLDTPILTLAPISDTLTGMSEVRTSSEIDLVTGTSGVRTDVEVVFVALDSEKNVVEKGIEICGRVTPTKTFCSGEMEIGIEVMIGVEEVIGDEVREFI